MSLYNLPEKLNLTDKTILITGGTGSYGSCFTQLLLRHYPEIGQLIIFSRDEFKQLEQFNAIHPDLQAKVKFILGDIRDKEALDNLFKKKIDIIIHAAALKHISFSETNPTEFIKTNISGSKNIFDAANKYGVEKCLVISSDKAASASNTYGRTKAEMEKLMHLAQSNGPCTFSAIRFGNFWASRGSVVPQFIQQLAKRGSVTLFNETSTRFFIQLEDAVRFSFQALEKSAGGEIFIPKLPSITIRHIAEAIAAGKIEIIKNRKGEKTHENLLSETEMVQALESDAFYILTNSDQDYSDFKRIHQATAIQSFELLRSNTNTFKFSKEDVNKLVAEYRKNVLLQLGFDTDQQYESRVSL